MGMYTDWGNLKVVSCGAWENGAGPGSSTVAHGNGRIGGVHFGFKRRPSGHCQAPYANRKRRQLGDGEKFR